MPVTRTATAMREGRRRPRRRRDQARSVRGARAIAADLVDAMTGKAEDVLVHFELPDDIAEAVEHARAMTAEAPRLASVAADEYRQAVRELVVARGMSKVDVAALLQVSPQRVSQLVP